MAGIPAVLEATEIEYNEIKHDGRVVSVTA